jgi:hypothetical protein
MAKSQWKMEPVRDGIRIVHLKKWSQFFDYILERALEYPYYVWRGQHDASWLLRSSFDRAIVALGRTVVAPEVAYGHLSAFRRAARGRRGPFPAKLEDDNEAWALGQHHGLATPLLDWTESPFVALYFAFAQEAPSETGERAVWALYEGDREGTLRRSQRQTPLRKGVTFIRPTQDENARLVSQSGLFTRAPWGKTIDEFVRKAYKGTSDYIVLVKIYIPDEGRVDCLRTLNRMNINHLSLFPDLVGSAEHCNRSLRIPNY